MIFFHTLFFQCPICKRNLKKGEHMSEHMRSHKLEAPLQCNYPGCKTVRHNFKYDIYTTHSNYKHFRLQRQSIQCKYMWSNITCPVRKSHQIYKVLYCQSLNGLCVCVKRIAIYYQLSTSDSSLHKCIFLSFLVLL